jgi:UDP-glucuronate decarboxylase
MIRWITERLGTCAYDERPDGDHHIVDVRHLVDKGGNSSAAIRESVEAGAAALKSGRTVVVACDFGVSRSNSIAAGILGVNEGRGFDDCVAQVLAATGESEIKLDMVQSVREALSESPPATVSRTGTVLVTGGSGFLGQNLLPRLKTSHRVLTPGREVLDLQDGAVKLAAYCRAEGVGQIVHLAYPRVYTNIGAMAVGLAMLRTVLDTCKLLDIRLVFASSSVLYGGYAATELIADESTPFRPKGAYSDAKFLEEMLLDAYAQRGDVRRSICRLAPVFGPGGDRPRLIKNFAAGISSEKNIHTHRYLNGRPALDLLYVSDAAEAIARTVEHEADSVFHFGSGMLHSTVEIAELIADLLGAPLAFQELLIDDDIANIRMDSRRAERVLNWSPAVLLRQGLAQCLGVNA